MKKKHIFFFEKTTTFFDGSDQLTGDGAHSQVMELNVR